MTNQQLSPLAFALLVDTAPGLTEDVVTEAFEAAMAAWLRRDDLETEPPEEALRDGVTKVWEEIGDFNEDDAARMLGAPVNGRPIVKPIRNADLDALTTAVARFVSFTGRLPHLGTWDDRQAVWSMLPGSRATETPLTDCAGAYQARNTKEAS